MNTAEQVEISAIAEDAVLVEWQETISPTIQQAISHLKISLNAALSHKVIEMVSSYNSLLIYYRFDLITYSQLLETIIEHTANSTVSRDDTSNTPELNIPVYYHGVDLDHVANQLSLSVKEVIDHHSTNSYIAYAHGFTPGFCYLASLVKQLQLPRRDTPRTNVPKGAVAIAGQQTAVYPNISPGGWHIIGYTPLPMYTTQSQVFEPAINLGQVVRFTAISKEKFIALGGNLEEISRL
ncbi:allophanate hydrolase subunit 1 [Thalassotalea sp. 1_MG-2023]|uniref:5-oxoprolinase subunit B family protein n=1 Tax=Thalassotalea sp. 1_MG-2023 TaxID=3062680 RepID=UPI0026E334FB|nr:allophanate hydrolase subunit 1 [Thalassotalea sp. 1_MG-2023]MDO6425910.1 allophanate hydrolase subunit 1 [Thalassotalea sp. 1_MG-2023]